MSNIKEDEIASAIKRHGDRIIALKARASSSVVGELGIEPIKRAKELSKKFNLPLVVHLGNYPPGIEDVLNLLERGDVATHAFHGKPNGIFDEEGKLKKEVIEARKRGVLFDVGHGSASFSFRIFKKAIEQGFMPDLISTDLYCKNMNGPVYNLANVVTKVVNCGVSLKEAMAMVTNVPAALFNLGNIGEIAVGHMADFSILDLEECKETLADSQNEELEITKKLNLVMTISSRGQNSEIFRHTKEQS